MTVVARVQYALPHLTKQEIEDLLGLVDQLTHSFHLDRMGEPSGPLAELLTSLQKRCPKIVDRDYALRFVEAVRIIYRRFDVR